MKDILILGIGNLVLNDEGIGVHIVHMLKAIGMPSDVELLDGGTGGLSLIETLQEYKNLILIDASLDEHPVGTVRRLSPQYATDCPPLMSTHEVGLREMIDAMRMQGKMPHIELLAISVRHDARLGMQLSTEVRRAIPQVLQLIFEILDDMRHTRYF